LRANFGGTSEGGESDTAHDGTTVTVRGGAANPAAVRGRRGRGLGVADAAAADTVAKVLGVRQATLAGETRAVVRD